MPHAFEILDVFTRTPLEGNPLAVVHAADDLDVGRMQAIAAEFNLSETIFIRAPAEAGNTASARIFTPARELPFAGHPTVGAAVALGLAHGADAVAIELPAGTVHCTVDRPAGRAAFDAPKRPELVPGEPDAGIVAEALGLPVDAIGFGGLAIAQATSGPTFTVVPVREAGLLACITLNRAVWQSAFGEGFGAAYVIAPEGEGAYRARMFAPLDGIAEDPATGSAAVAFAAVFASATAPADGLHAILIRQGVEMGRPSVLHIEVEMVAGAIGRVGLSGEAVVIASGRLRI